MLRITLLLTVGISLLSRYGLAETQNRNDSLPAITYRDVSYGQNERNVLDFWKADSDKNTPLVVFIHGGGFRAGDKKTAWMKRKEDIEKCLSYGVSYASINYPFTNTTRLDSILLDCARAIQFLRYKAEEWNIDKSQIAVYGISAGAGTSTWIGMYDDLKDPDSLEPILRESSRVQAVGALGVQSTYDVAKWTKILDVDKDWPEKFDDIDLKLYHIKSREEYYKPEIVKLRAFCDFPEFIDEDDPPIFIRNNDREGDILHAAKHAMYLKEKCDAAKIESHIIITPPKVEASMTVIDFFLEELLENKEDN